MNSGNKRLIQTIIVSGLSVLIGYLINFFVTPYITSNIGMDAYGFVSIAGTTVNYATIITTALTSFIVRYISISYHEDNLEEANKYYSSSIAASAVLAGIIFVFAACITSKLELFLNIPEELVTSVKTLFVIVYINFFVTTITIPFGASAYIKNRLDITGYAKVAGHLCNVAVLLLLFTLFEPRVWFVTLGTLSVSIISLTVSYIMTKKITPELIFKRTDIVFVTTRNGLFFGIIFVFIGKLLADQETRLKEYTKVFAVILGVAVVGCFLESYFLIRIYSKTVINMNFMSVPLSVVVVALSVSLGRGIRIGRAVMFRRMSTIIFCVHPWIMSTLAFVLAHINFNFSVYMKVGIIITITTAVSYVLVKLRGRVALLKYLM